jgi:hypothetical protein
LRLFHLKRKRDDDELWTLRIEMVNFNFDEMLKYQNRCINSVKLTEVTIRKKLGGHHAPNVKDDSDPLSRSLRKIQNNLWKYVIIQNNL